ncbi:MAG TPA: septum formation initiator family protein [Candidatus Saccharimonadales bacterium]|nr:septum formation initiator family protein [Candidatus Saccharimonadales bacterium]
MPRSFRSFWNLERLKQLTDARNVGLYIFVLIVLAIAWSGAKTLQKNYELQKQISVLKQQNNVLGLYNQTVDLQNKFYQTNQYLELAARQNLGLAAPGETVLLVPQSVAMKYVNPSLNSGSSADSASSSQSKSKTAQNLQDWRDFLLGRKLVSQ